MYIIINYIQYFNWERNGRESQKCDQNEMSYRLGNNYKG